MIYLLILLHQTWWVDFWCCFFCLFRFLIIFYYFVCFSWLFCGVFFVRLSGFCFELWWKNLSEKNIGHRDCLQHWISYIWGIGSVFLRPCTWENSFCYWCIGIFPLLLFLWSGPMEWDDQLFSPSLVLISCCCSQKAPSLWVWLGPFALSCVVCWSFSSWQLGEAIGHAVWNRMRFCPERFGPLCMKLIHSINKQPAYVRIPK